MQLVLLIPVQGGDLIGGGHPSQGLPGGGHITGWPVHPPGHPDAGLPIPPVYVNGKPIYPPGHPSQGLPIQPGHPSQGLPGGGHVGNRPPNVPPNVTWPPTIPDRPDNTLPPELVKPSNPIVLPEGDPLPAGSAFVAVYTTEKGWTATVIKGSGAQPK